MVVSVCFVSDLEGQLEGVACLTLTWSDTARRVFCKCVCRPCGNGNADLVECDVRRTDAASLAADRCVVLVSRW
jgi:hypothetical protein